MLAMVFGQPALEDSTEKVTVESMSEVLVIPLVTMITTIITDSTIMAMHRTIVTTNKSQGRKLRISFLPRRKGGS